MKSKLLVEMRDVCKSFSTRHFFFLDEATRQRRWYKKKTVHAAVSINFDIRPGEVFGLLGPNGAGKTTTVKMISGLVRPDSGEVLVAGMNVEKKRKKILQRIGTVLEGTRTSIWPLTPLENLMYYGRLRNVNGRILKDRAHELLDFIGLQDKKNVEVRRLSRGQKQKLAICIALISDPQVLLLDEPTTGLDVQSARAIKDKVIELTRRDGRGVLVTTHDMHVAQELCDRIGIIHRGRLITCKPTHELLGLFSEQIYAFELDRRPETEGFLSLPGVLSATVEEDSSGVRLIAQVSAEAEPRSAALCAITAHIHAQRHTLRAIDHRKQNLEHVFLQLTGESHISRDE